jgi:hypothetical protein
MRRLLIYSIAILATVAVARVTHATVILPAEFREVVAGSDVIAHVQIVDVRPEWADGRRRIDSVITATVVSSFKGGQRGDTIAFRVPGGELGRYRSVTVGAPSFRAGEEAVLFLSSAGDASLHVFGLNQGVFRVREDAGSGRRMVVTPILSARSDGPERVVRGNGSRRPVSVEDFGAQVRTVIAELQRVPR